MTRRNLQIVRGKFGRIWVNGEVLSNCKEFEAKVTMNYEEIVLAEEFGTNQRYMGYSVEGTITLYKIDSKVAKLLKDGIKSGVLPEIKIVARVADPDSGGTERVELTDVTFDEMTLLKFDTSALVEEEVPFKAGSYNYLDLMSD